MSKKWSKIKVAQYCNNVRIAHIEQNNFDMNDGTHQFLKLFNNDLIKQINNFNTPDTDENWDIKRAAEDKIYNIINKVVAYGIKTGMQGVMENFDLYEDLRKEEK